MTKDDLEALPYALVGAAKGVWEQEPAAVAWGATLALPTIYDVWAMHTGRETMSHAYRRGVEHPLYRFMFIGAVGALAVHLCHSNKEDDPRKIVLTALF